jgi:AraC-like DNA-binding protein
MFLPIVKPAAMTQKDPFFINRLKFRESRNREIFRNMLKDRIPRLPGERQEALITRKEFLPIRAGEQPGFPPMIGGYFLTQAVLYQVDFLLLVHNGSTPVLSQSIPDVFPRGMAWWGKRPIDGPHNSIVKQLSLFGGGTLIYVWIYIILIMIGVITYSKKIRNRSTSNERRNMMWLTVLFTVIGIVQTMMTFLFIFSSPFERPFTIFRLSSSLPSPLLYIFTICGYLIFTRKRRVDEKKYGKNGLSTSELDRYFKVLIKYMREKMPYRKESLTLKQIAEDLNIHANNLSQVINKKEGCNFRDFINSFRVEEVKKELLKPRSKDKNILSIAYESGFNSKSAFNLIFKKHTDMTPSEYIKKFKK